MPRQTVPSPEAALPAAQAQLQDAAQTPAGIAVLTGAGMSAESGIATFRDAMTGLWSRFDPAALASEAGFRADPSAVWNWYAQRREAMRRTQPNAGHHALASFSQDHPGVLRVVTQNVDDLHQRAGSLDTIALHGHLLADRWLDRCPRAGRGGVAQAGGGPERDADGRTDRRTFAGAACAPATAQPGQPPRCADCGNLLRPDVVWFGEMLPLDAMQAAQRLVDQCRVLLVVGTSGAVWPAAGLAERGRRQGAFVLIVNPEPSEIDDQAHLLLRGTAAGLLPTLLASAG